MLSFLFIALIWVGCGVAASLIAASKGRTGCGWFLIGFLFGPLGLLAALIISPDPAHNIESGLSSGQLRRCPRCAEPIHHSATICRYCQSSVDPTPTPKPQLSLGDMTLIAITITVALAFIAAGL